jgi:hypothetical protein
MMEKRSFAFYAEKEAVMVFNFTSQSSLQLH